MEEWRNGDLINQMQGQQSLLSLEAYSSASTRDLLKALSAATAAQTRDLRTAYSAATLEAASSASTLDLLRAPQTAMRLSASISAASLDLLRADSVSRREAASSAASLDLLRAFSAETRSTAISASTLERRRADSAATSASIRDRLSAASEAAREAASQAQTLERRRAPSTSRAVTQLNGWKGTWSSRGSNMTYSSFDKFILTAQILLIQVCKLAIKQERALRAKMILIFNICYIRRENPNSTIQFRQTHRQLQININYIIVMFGWCCQQQGEINQELFVYRGSGNQNGRQLINPSQLNSVLLKEENMYQVFAASQYDTLLKKCRQRKEDFTDKDFDIKKLGLSKIKGRKITWRRLKQFATSPNDQLYERRTMAEIMDLNTDDSYFLASIAALSQQPTTIMAILDGMRSFNEQGIYRLNVCVSGKPKQIVVDDYLPVFEDNTSRTVYVKAQQGALWVLLLEKAYAKLKGGYNNIVSGFVHDVLTTFTVAPCLSHIIPLSFDIESQEALWVRLIQARKNRFPVVCGSRKQYTCKGIDASHAYPLVDCWVQEKKGHRSRMIRLVNIPSEYEQCQHNGQCSFVVEDQSLKLQLVEFMRNFEIIDVAHLRPDFSSHFYSYRSLPGQYKFYTVGIPSNISFYLTLQHGSQEKGRIRIFLARVLQDQLTDFQLVSCKSQDLFSDVSLEFHNLPEGKYMICCQSSIKADCHLRVYSQAQLLLLEIKQQPIRFLQHIFFDYALSHKEGFYSLSKNSNDWYFSKTMFDEIEMGFLIINLHNTSTIKCYLSYKKDELERQGFTVVNKGDKFYKVELKHSDIQILIFEISAKNAQKDCLEFPPRALQIKVVI